MLGEDRFRLEMWENDSTLGNQETSVLPVFKDLVELSQTWMSPVFISEMFQAHFPAQERPDGSRERTRSRGCSCADFLMVYERDQVLMRSLCWSKLRHNDNGVGTNYYTPLSLSLPLSLLSPGWWWHFTLPRPPQIILRSLLTTKTGTRNVLYLPGCRPPPRPQLQSSMWEMLICSVLQSCSVDVWWEERRVPQQSGSRPVTRSAQLSSVQLSRYSQSTAQPPAGEPGLGLRLRLGTNQGKYGRY